MMSTGCKMLCCIYYLNHPWWYGSQLADNCLPFLMRICEYKDVNLMFEHYPEFDSKYFEEGKIRVNGNVVTEFEFDDLFSEWSASCGQSILYLKENKLFLSNMRRLSE